MSFRIYRCGYTTEKHERNQMDRFIRYLEQEFSHRREDCSVIIDPSFPYKNMAGVPIRRIPDAIIVKDNILVIIKSYCMEQRGHLFESQRKIEKL